MDFYVNDFAKASYERSMKNNKKGTFNWQYFVIASGGEAGEMMSLLKEHLRGDPDSDTPAFFERLAEEAADTITYALLVLSALEYDPAHIILEKYERVNRRLAAGGFDARPEQQ